MLHFVELDEFGDDWERLGLDIENDLWDLQIEIMSGPDEAPIISGTGGLRKMRFAPYEWRSGRSGAARVCYAYFKRHNTVLLVMAYGKGRKQTLTAAEKRGIKLYLATIERWLDERHEKNQKR